MKPFSFKIGHDAASGIIALQEWQDDAVMKYMETKELHIRDALIKLGWCPPEEKACFLDALRKAKEALEATPVDLFENIDKRRAALKTIARALETVHTKDDALNPKDS